jgi:hypothetical protein
MSSLSEPSVQAPTPGQRYCASVARWGPGEIIFWAALLAVFFIPGANLPLYGQILIWGLFAMSLDLLLGYRGIPSLGPATLVHLDGPNRSADCCWLRLQPDSSAGLPVASFTG